MRRILISAIALGSAVVGFVPAMAGTGQPIDIGQAAGVSVTGLSPDGRTLQLGLTGFALSAGSRLAVTVQRCDEDGSCDAETYAAPLTPADFSVDASASRATLRTTLSGQPLIISWTPSDTTGPTLEVGAAQFDAWGGGDAAGVGWFGRGADTTVRYAGSTCKTDGGVGAGVLADTQPVDGNPTTTPVSDLHLQDGSGLHC